MSSRQQFLLPNVTPGTRVRLDTASGSDSAADVVNNLNQAISGSIVTADSTGRLASGDIYGPAGVTTLYMKTLDGSGNVTGSPVTLGGAHPTSSGSDPRVDTILANAPTALDTLKEIADTLASDETAATALTTAVGLRGIDVSHGSTAGTARPTSSLPVTWHGTVAPTNAVARDLWYDEANDLVKRYNGSAWVTAGGTSGQASPSTFVSKSSAYTAAAGEWVECTTTTAGFTVTLPANPAAGALVAVQKISADTNTLTISPSGGGTIDGDATATAIPRWAGGVFAHKGSNVWHYYDIGPTVGAALEATTAPPSTNTTGSVLGTATTGAHSDHTHAIGAHDHSTTAKGGTLNPTTALSSTGTPSSSTFLRGDNTWATPAGGGGVGLANIVPARVCQSAIYVAAFPGTGVGTTNYPLGLLVAMPFVPAANYTLDRIGIEVTTLGATSEFRVGLYADNGAGYPGALITEFTSGGTLSGAATGTPEKTISQAVTAGTLYWIAFVQQTSTTAFFRTVSSPLWGNFGGSSASNATQSNKYTYSQSSVTGALPANFTTTKTPDTAGSVPNVFIRAA